MDPTAPARAQVWISSPHLRAPSPEHPLATKPGTSVHSVQLQFQALISPHLSSSLLISPHLSSSLLISPHLSSSLHLRLCTFQTFQTFQSLQLTDQGNHRITNIVPAEAPICSWVRRRPCRLTVPGSPDRWQSRPSVQQKALGTMSHERHGFCRKGGGIFLILLLYSPRRTGMPGKEFEVSISFFSVSIMNDNDDPFKAQVGPSKPPFRSHRSCTSDTQIWKASVKSSDFTAHFRKSSFTS